MCSRYERTLKARHSPEPEPLVQAPIIVDNSQLEESIEREGLEESEKEEGEVEIEGVEGEELAPAETGEVPLVPVAQAETPALIASKGTTVMNASASTPMLRSMLVPPIRIHRPGDEVPGVRFSKQTSRPSLINKKGNPNERRFENTHLFPKILSHNRNVGALVEF